MVAMSVSIIGLMFLLVVLGSGALLMLLVVVAVASRYPGFAATLGGAVLLGVLALGGLLSGLAAPASHLGPHDSWSWAGVFGRALLAALAVAMIAMTLYHAKSPAGGRFRGWWPLLLVPMLFGVYFLARFGVGRTHQTSPHTAARQMAAVEHDVTRQHAEIARHTAEMSATMQHQFANVGIHALMDAHDAPRITLPPDPPTPPDSPAEAAATTGANEPPAESESESELDVTAADAESGETQQATGGSQNTPDSDDPSAADETSEKPATPVRPEKRARSRESRAPVLRRPAWVDDPPKRVGNAQREVIVVGEYQTVEECYRVADVYLLLATYDHLTQIGGMSNVTNRSRPSLTLHGNSVLAGGDVIISDGRAVDSRLSRLAAMGVGIDYIRREIAKDEYIETVERSFGPMKNLYTLIEFSPTVDRELRARWDASRRGERFAVVGVGAGSVLGLLGLAWGLLKLDTLTRGYYTKRLFLGVPAAIIGGWLLLTAIIEISE